jgi:hypothetical protein
LFERGKGDLEQFAFAVILWGYPAGTRGNNAANLLPGLPRLAQELGRVRDDLQGSIRDWPTFWRGIKSNYGGLGMSTLSKLLHFLGVRVEGLKSLILDQRLIEFFRSTRFPEFAQLSEIRYDRAADDYLLYLRRMNEVSRKLRVNPANLEMTLYLLGDFL